MQRSNVITCFVTGWSLYRARIVIWSAVAGLCVAACAFTLELFAILTRTSVSYGQLTEFHLANAALGTPVWAYAVTMLFVLAAKHTSGGDVTLRDLPAAMTSFWRALPLFAVCALISLVETGLRFSDGVVLAEGLVLVYMTQFTVTAVVIEQRGSWSAFIRGLQVTMMGPAQVLLLCLGVVAIIVVGTLTVVGLLAAIPVSVLTTTTMFRALAQTEVNNP